MLNFYQTYQKYKVPSTLEGEIINVSGEALKVIDNFNKVNIFIGSNNSGKSKILRELLKEDSFPHYGDKNWNLITELIDGFYDTVSTKLKEVIAAPSHFIIHNNRNGQIINTAEINEERKRGITNTSNYDMATTISNIKHKFVNLITSLNKTDLYRYHEIGSTDNLLSFEAVDRLFSQLDEIKQYAVSTIEKLGKLQYSSLSKEKITKIYIPSIRTLRPFGAKAEIERGTRKEYDFKENVKIYNGEAFPKQVFDLTNTTFDENQKLVEFEELLSKEFFESKKVKLTFHQKMEVLLIKIGDEKQRPIHELGDGLQMIIILLFPFFDNKSGLIAIEEPELFIHPGIQKTFIKFLISNKATENFQIFISTHSNHIIDSINQSDKISLFSLRKKERPGDESIEKTPNFIIENLAFGNNNLLSLLGITTTSVYLSNCTIWVEGITDRIYIQKFIVEYLKSVDKNSQYFNCIEYVEGINYSFALTAGDSIVHWDFSDNNEYLINTGQIIVSKFCSKSMVIIDNDFRKNPKRKELLSEILKERFVELPVPEIENLLPEIVIKKTILEYPSVSKAVKDEELPSLDNKIIFKKKMGSIIDEYLLKNYPQTKKFAAKKGKNSSLKSGDKFDFCNKSIDHITKNNLTRTSIELVEKILDFIISKNSK